jgi:hypothetical protein
VISLDLILFNDAAEEEAKRYLATKGYRHVHGRKEPVVYVADNF